MVESWEKLHGPHGPNKGENLMEEPISEIEEYGYLEVNFPLLRKFDLFSHNKELPLTPEERIVFTVIDDLSDRSGIGNALEDVDYDVRDEMLQELVEKVKALL